MKRNVAKGTASNIFHIFIQDSSQTDGSGLTGLAWNTGSLTAYYIREGAATPVEITLVTATVGTFASGGFKEVDATNLPGVYEFHPPNAAFVTGAEAVVFMLKGATDMAVIPLEIQLIDAHALASIVATAAALTAHDNKLAPVALDGGDPTIGGMLTKIADDSGGAGFNATDDSLQAIGDKVHTQGTGAITWTYTLTSTVAPNDPIADADVWVTTDEAGTNVIASGRTNASGVVTFFLDAGTVYVFSQKSGVDFDNPDEETVP